MSKEPDDLTPITDLGKGSQKLLNAAGIFTFQDLAGASQQQIRDALDKGGPGYKRLTTKTWKAEAKKLAKKQKSFRKKSTRKPSSRPKETSKSQPKTKTDGANPVVPVSFSSSDGGVYQPGLPFRIERILTFQEAEWEFAAREEELKQQFDRANKAIEKLLKEWRKTGGTTKRIERGTSRIHKKESVEKKVCRLMKEGNVTAVSARYRTKFGHPVSPLQVVIAINVDKKVETQSELDSDPASSKAFSVLPAAVLPAEDFLPKQYEGIPIKVIEGQFYLLAKFDGYYARGAGQPKNPIPFDAPVVGGIPIAPPSNLADFGTLGLLHATADRLLGLTCQHVVDGGKGAKVVQLGDSNGWREFASVQDAVLPKDRNANGFESVDCATIEVDTVNTKPTVKLPKNGLWAMGFNAAPSNNKTIPLLVANDTLTKNNTKARLWKFGNGTGTLLPGRVGTIEHANVVIELDNGTLVEYSGNFSIQRPDADRGYVAGGDSGAIVAIEARVKSKAGKLEDVFLAIGLLFAALGDGTTGLVCSTQAVLKALNLKDELKDVVVQDWVPGWL
ncbi:MAG: hypothetical protein WBD31_01010 [Rubripirellula sp.]